MANSFPVSLIFPEKEVVMWLQSAAEVYPLLWLATRGDKIVLLNDRSWSPVVFHNEIVFFPMKIILYRPNLLSQDA